MFYIIVIVFLITGAFKLFEKYNENFTVNLKKDNSKTMKEKQNNI